MLLWHFSATIGHRTQIQFAQLDIVHRSRQKCVMRIYLVLSALAMFFLSMAAAAHPGGLNSEGCHNNRKTGEYHCHRSSTRPTKPTRQLPSRLFDSPKYFANCAAARAAGLPTS